MSQAGLSVIINIDGGAQGNPGPAGAGLVIRAADDGTVLHRGGVFLGKQTNNTAEYKALLAALGAAARLGARRVEILSDSELLVRQMTGQYRVKHPNLKPLHAKAMKLLDNFVGADFRHIRREENFEADRLVKQAVKAKKNVEDDAEG